nr:PREDICTED: cysteine sulfinic acid decarboxylase [Struthio camelus australis]
MAESSSLEHPALDKAAGEEFLQEAFQILLEEVVRKGMDVTEKYPPLCRHLSGIGEPGAAGASRRFLLSPGRAGRARQDGDCPHRSYRGDIPWPAPLGDGRRLRAGTTLLRVFACPAGACGEEANGLSPSRPPPGHPRFFNQLFSGLDHHALVGRMITEALNTSQYTYEIAPVFVLMEEVVLAKLRELVGWSSGDGIFSPGGSISNMYAMNVARYCRFPESKQKGSWALPRLALFTSRESHYSIQKGAAFLGIGTDNVYLVGVDERGKMIPEELEKEIERAKAEGAVPFFVSATSGTTVLGAFDPLGSIADVCQRHGIWFHVDAAWGGSALLSRKHRHLLTGIERADSVVWNPHKMLMVGLQCSAFLLRDGSGLLQRCYAFGTEGLERRGDRAFAFTRYLAEEAKRREGFQLVLEPEFVNLCFWFVPPSLRGKEGSADYWPRLGKVAPAIKERMMKTGSMMVGYQPHGAKVNFFRQVVTNPAVTRADLDFFLDEIERLRRGVLGSRGPCSAPSAPLHAGRPRWMLAR